MNRYVRSLTIPARAAVAARLLPHSVSGGVRFARHPRLHAECVALGGAARLLGRSGDDLVAAIDDGVIETIQT
jgi:hypothetical protein